VKANRRFAERTQRRFSGDGRLKVTDEVSPKRICSYLNRKQTNFIVFTLIQELSTRKKDTSSVEQARHLIPVAAAPRFGCKYATGIFV